MIAVRKNRGCWTDSSIFPDLIGLNRGGHVRTLRQKSSLCIFMRSRMLRWLSLDICCYLLSMLQKCYVQVFELIYMKATKLKTKFFEVWSKCCKRDLLNLFKSIYHMHPLICIVYSNSNIPKFHTFHIQCLRYLCIYSIWLKCLSKVFDDVILANLPHQLK